MVRNLRPVAPAGDALPAHEDYCGTSYAAKLLGLSVATVQALVEKGDIEAWKTQGGHRRISLRSVNAYLQRYSPNSVHLLPPPQQRLQVLVVEDDEDLRALYRAHFDEWGLAMDCTLAESALEALMDVASLQPDLLVTDLKMPEVDGIEMLRVMKGRHQLNSMHVLVLTGMDTGEIEGRGGLPPDATLRPKPVNFDWLHGYVSALLAARRKLA